MSKAPIRKYLSEPGSSLPIPDGVMMANGYLDIAVSVYAYSFGNRRRTVQPLFYSNSPSSAASTGAVLASFRRARNSFQEQKNIIASINLIALLGNIVIAEPETAVVANRPIPEEDLWVSINPMPGGFAGWQEIKDSLRFTRTMPYNTLSELGAPGWTTLVLVGYAAAAALSPPTRIASNLSGTYATVAGPLALGCAGFFSVSIFQRVFDYPVSLRIC
jgi:hypothetical protein